MIDTPPHVRRKHIKLVHYMVDCMLEADSPCEWKRGKDPEYHEAWIVWKGSKLSYSLWPDAIKQGTKTYTTKFQRSWRLT